MTDPGFSRGVEKGWGRGGERGVGGGEEGRKVTVCLVSADSLKL